MIDFCTGQNTMIILTSKGRIFKTGHKLDYSPKLVEFGEDCVLMNEK